MKHRILAIALLALVPALALVACAENPADDVPAAQIDSGTVVESAADSGPAEQPTIAVDAETATGALPSGTFPLTGTLLFKASKVTASHVVEFKSWEGTYASDGTIEGTSLTFSANVASLVADEADGGPLTGKLEDHLRSADFFDVETYPRATFTSSKIVAGVDPALFANATGATHTIVGNLDVRGTTKEISFPVTLVDDGSGRISASTEFAVDRQDFGLVYPGAPDDLIRDEVVIVVDATLVVD